ncbi:hypothetical protein [Aquisediminimonas profunda]|uniref:hypothetical protein n=1 Tax=Aquisediminimonas profunda TaxID=1550733 RepID=UPI001C62A044|nr:hypothetical protein [Aquisediminimonas profunda]
MIDRAFENARGGGDITTKKLNDPARENQKFRLFVKFIQYIVVLMQHYSEFYL